MNLKPIWQSLKTKFIIVSIIVIANNLSFGQSAWFEKESKNFKVIFRENHSHLAPKILSYAENSLHILQDLFNYNPAEKIIINTYDAADYGFGTTTTLPLNYIRLEISPMEYGYEVIPFDNRLKWIISHELVHVIVNDKPSKLEKVFRSLFSKVTPEQIHPQTIFFSLLTSFNRYTPRWHQESIAVFLETWMNGGFGRIFGSFDEMYFRSMVLENKSFSKDIELETKTSQISFLLENLFYIYGARFASYLALTYGYEKLIQWFDTSEDEFYQSFESRFKSTFNKEMTEAWNDFLTFETNFQYENLARLNLHTTSELKSLNNNTYGWVTQPYLDNSGENILFAFHRPHHLAQIHRLNLRTGNSIQLTTLPTPSIIQVASTAFDRNLNLFFYTTNNNQLYRDIWLLDTESNEKKLLFENCRVGNLTVSPQSHELWGVEHSSGLASIVYSAYPYVKLERIFQFNYGEEIPQLAISPSGENIAAVLHRKNGDQKIILINIDSLKNNRDLRYITIYDNGSPENISWSDDEKYIFWNAYTSGVSNIYRFSFHTNKVEAISHTLRGLFRPLHLNQDSIFAFEFTSEGFRPVIVENKPASYVPAIKYLGQVLQEKYPKLLSLNLTDSIYTEAEIEISSKRNYNSLSNIHVNTLIPVISGFQTNKVIGLWGNFSDPLLVHDLSLEVGYSPFKENKLSAKFHFKLKYEYQKQVEINLEHNGSDFYDLFNKRKRGLAGTKVGLGYNNYWIYDNPLKIKQRTYFEFYEGVNFFNDNLIKVLQPNFMLIRSTLDLKNQRRSIGSVDFEYGSDFSASVLLYATEFNELKSAYQLWLEYGNLTTWLLPHNILYIKGSAGYNQPNDRLTQARFFFGGFGNREIEHEKAKQYRETFRFPGIPIYSLTADNFFKLLIENNFPPLRFSNLSLSRHYLNYLDFSIFTQALAVKSQQGRYWANIGGQVNFIFKLWDNLESTLSAGAAIAWFSNGNDWEWFLSLKLLKN